MRIQETINEAKGFYQDVIRYLERSGGVTVPVSREDAINRLKELEEIEAFLDEAGYSIDTMLHDLGKVHDRMKKD